MRSQHPPPNPTEQTPLKGLPLSVVLLSLAHDMARERIAVGNTLPALSISLLVTVVISAGVSGVVFALIQGAIFLLRQAFA
ncbi:MAG: hypothetical protein ACI83N_000320 [Hydrogenophaga sp.]|jgi:hypothetical protein